MGNFPVLRRLPSTRLTPEIHLPTVLPSNIWGLFTGANTFVQILTWSLSPQIATPIFYYITTLPNPKMESRPKEAALLH